MKKIRLTPEESGFFVFPYGCAEIDSWKMKKYLSTNGIARFFNLGSYISNRGLIGNII